MKIAIIDYGMGNLRSVEKAFHFVGAGSAFVTDDPVLIASADKAVLPGDGAFDTTMDNLRFGGIERVVKEFVATCRPFLGICIGMQALLFSSEEGRAGVAGLELVPGKVKRFPIVESDGRTKLPVPQIGWNRLTVEKPGALLSGLENSEPFVYFLHSYFCAPTDPSATAGTADYGLRYCAAIESGNIFATQFHPEKSGDAGLHILQNFARL